MRLLIGPSSETLNVDHTTVNKSSDAYTLDVKVGVVYSNPTNTFAGKSLFIIASTSDGLANEFMINPSAAIPYIKRQKQSQEIVVQSYGIGNTRSLPTTQPSMGHLIKSFTKRLEVNKTNIDDLTIFAGIYKVIHKRVGDIYSIISSDSLRIFKDGNIPQQNLVLFENQARTKLWIGSSFQDTTGHWYKSASGPVKESNQLYIKMVPNTKVTYESSITEKVLQLSKNNLFNLNKLVNSKQAIVNKLKSETRNYFSPLYYAKTRNLSLPISFSFNRLAFYRNNGAFSHLIKNDASLIGSLDIVATRILRKRVTVNRPQSRLTGVGPTKDFDGIERVVTNSPDYVNFLQSTNIVDIVAEDKEMNDITYGLYAYGVELTILDNTHNKLQNVLNQSEIGLRPRVSQVEDIYLEMVQPGNYNAYSDCLTEEYKSLYASSERETKVIDCIKSYISALSLFHANFAASFGATPDLLATQIYSMINPLTKGPVALSGLTKLVKDLISQISRKIYAGNVPSSTAQNVTTKSSKLGSGARLIKVKHYFDSIVDADDLTDKGYDYFSTSEEDVTAPVYAPFRYISYDNFANIITLEEEKYNDFTFTAADVIAITPNYFNLGGNDIKINSNDANQDSLNSLVGTSILAANKYMNSPTDFQQFSIKNNSTSKSTTSLSILNNQLKVMEKQNCVVSVDRGGDSLFSSISPTKGATSSDLLDIAEKFDESSPLIINKGGYTSLSSFLNSAKNNNSGEKFNKFVGNLNENILTYLIQTDYFAPPAGPTTPTMTVKNFTDKKVFTSKNSTIATFKADAAKASANIGKSRGAKTVAAALIGGPMTTAPVLQTLNYGNIFDTPVSASMMTSAAIKHGNVKKVQYFAGYRKQNNSIFMKDPVWIDLTGATLGNAQAKGRPLLCRIAESYSEFSKYAGIESPVYDRIFIIGIQPTLPSALPASVTDFTTLPEGNFSSMKDMKGMDQDMLQYSTSPMHDKNLDPSKKNGNGNGNSSLYTNGGDFLLPNGEKYIGFYHIYYMANEKKNIAMVGRTHSSAAHDKLAPVSNKARRLLRNTPPPPSTPSGNGGGNGAAGTGGY
jgi:hypothetical protein